MTALLRKLACDPHRHLVAEAYFAALNFVATGLLTEEQITQRLLSKTKLPDEDACSAIERGISAARPKLPDFRHDLIEAAERIDHA
jgi:hypothetical protein